MRCAGGSGARGMRKGLPDESLLETRNTQLNEKRDLEPGIPPFATRATGEIQPPPRKLTPHSLTREGKCRRAQPFLLGHNIESNSSIDEYRKRLARLLSIHFPRLLRWPTGAYINHPRYPSGIKRVILLPGARRHRLPYRMSFLPIALNSEPRPFSAKRKP